MAKPLTFLESTMVQIIVQIMKGDNCNDETIEKALLRIALTKQQANKALGR